MSNNTPDYKDDIVFLPPETTDRTQSTIDLINRIEALTLDNDRKSQHLTTLSNYINQLETRIEYLKVLLSTCRDIILCGHTDAEFINLITKIKEVLK